MLLYAMYSSNIENDDDSRLFDHLLTKVTN